MADVVLECEHCKGKRFKQDVLDVLYRGKSIYDILEMTVNQAIEFFSEDSACKKIVNRLRPLQDVGIGYVKLGQAGSTLSGGESQRVKLASFLAQENATPTLFIFDEPTTGLHHHDVKVLLKALNALISRGHSVLVIEHNPSVILAADHIIDLGPEGGDEGGQIVAEGTPEEIMQCVARLPEVYRTVFNMFAIDGYSHKEIADSLNVSENTSRVYFLRARKLLQEMLEKNR